MAVARGVLQLAVLLQLVPLCADAYSRGAGSCHTASGGHGEATAGAGGFVLSLSAAPTAGSTVALRLVHAEAVSQFKGFLVKITGPGGEYDGGGAEFSGLEQHALAQSKRCYGPAAATHRSSELKDSVELDLVLPQEAVDLVATVAVMIYRSSVMDSEWYTWTQPISVAAAQPIDPTPGSGAQPPDAEGDSLAQSDRALGARCLIRPVSSDGPSCLTHLNCVLRPGVTCPEDASVSCLGICSDAPVPVGSSEELTIDPAPSDLVAAKPSGSRSTRYTSTRLTGAAMLLLLAAAGIGWV